MQLAPRQGSNWKNLIFYMYSLLIRNESYTMLRYISSTVKVGYALGSVFGREWLTLEEKSSFFVETKLSLFLTEIVVVLSMTLLLCCDNMQRPENSLLLDQRNKTITPLVWQQTIFRPLIICYKYLEIWIFNQHTCVLSESFS